jgi:hypothetical protein
MEVRSSRTLRIALAFGLVIASCPIATKLATLGNHAPPPAVVQTVDRPAPVAKPGQPKPPWLNDPTVASRMYIFTGGRTVVLDNPGQKRQPRK